MDNSPKIVKLSWGRIELDNGKVYKDVKLYPGGCREWNWNETGTQHSPGVQFTDVEELIANGAEEIILSKGVFGRLKIQENTIKRIESMKIPVYIYKTKDAVKNYNSAITNKKVGALIHTTC